MILEQKIQKFRFDLLRKQPFYGDIVMQLEFREDKSIPTACTDGKRVLYNPAFLNKLTDGQINFILMHEVFHILLMHCGEGRNAGRDPQVWNAAADYIVNSMLTDRKMMNAMKDCGIPFEKPNNGLFADLSSGETAENLYAVIVKDNESRMKDGKLNGNTLSVRKNYRWTGRQPDTTITVPPAESGQQGGDLLPGKLGDAERSALEAQIRDMVRQATVSDKNRSPFGSAPVPDAIYHLAESKKLNWKSLLKGMLQDVQSDETSWSTPERKYLHMDLILPGHGESEETLDEVWAFVDSSGSVGKDEMEQFLTQLYRILKEFHCTMHLAYWDTGVTDVYRSVRSEKKLLECIPHHSGGTNINCVYRWIRENKVRPEVMLVLTDGYFGTLTEQNNRLRRKTIVVLSKNSAKVDDNIRKVGKPAAL